jgi:rhomboid protease GluP
MPDPAPHPYAVILEECARAAPAPWYPSAYAQATGTPRDSLDPLLNDLRVGGLIRLTDWVQGHGQGYELTADGEDVLHSPRQLGQLRSGRLPVLSNGPPAAPAARPARFGSWDRGEAYRIVVMERMTPFVTLGLFAANVLWFFAGLAYARHLGLQAGDYLSSAAAAGADMQQVLHWEGAIDGVAVVEGHEWWRLLTAAFVHIGWIHVAVNMMSLLWVGPLLERLWGHGRFLIIYLVSAFTGNCGMLIEHPTGGGGGASTAIWGILAALAAWVFLNRAILPPRQLRSWTTQLVILFALNFWLTFDIPSLSKGGHFGGGIGGLLVCFPLDYLRFGGRRRGLGVAAVLAVPVAAAATLALYMAGPGGREMRQEREDLAARRELRERELHEFNDRYFGPVETTTQRCARVYDDAAELIRQRPPAGSKELRRALSRVAQARADLLKVEEALQDAGPYESRGVHDIQQRAVNYVKQLTASLEQAGDILKGGTPDPQELQRFNDQEARYREARRKWEALPREERKKD